MIHALDHIGLAVASLDAARVDYEALLGRRAGPGAASFQLANLRLDLRPHDGSGAGGLSTLAFAVDDLDKARRLLQRRALPVTVAGESATPQLHIAPAATHGVALSVVAGTRRADAAQVSATAEDASAVSGLDHVVIRTPDPERAVALYAGRLGLSLRLDRTEPAWGARLLFFRCGDLIVEAVHDLEAGITGAPDRLWGLSWRVDDIAKARARLQAAGLDVSEIRNGRRPGTQVLSVRNRTAGVPTLMIGAGGARSVSAAA